MQARHSCLPFIPPHHCDTLPIPQSGIHLSPDRNSRWRRHNRDWRILCIYGHLIDLRFDPLVVLLRGLPLLPHQTLRYVLLIIARSAWLHGEVRLTDHRCVVLAREQRALDADAATVAGASVNKQHSNMQRGVYLRLRHCLL